MRIGWTVEGTTDALLDLMGAEQAGGFHDLAFAVDPARLHRVEPGTLRGQITGEDTHTVPRLLDLLVVVPDPAAHRLTDVPGGIVPHHEQRALVPCGQGFTTPGQELRGHGTDGLAVHEAQPHFLAHRHAFTQANQQAVAGQRHRIRVIFGDRLFNQPQRLIGRGPAVQHGLGHATPPGLVLEAHGPLRVDSRQADQTVARPFFRAYSGSGLVIQCLARRQPTPRRASVARIVSPLTRAAVSPVAKLTSAARSNVQTLVWWPKTRGLRCSSARKCSAAAGSKAAWMVWGTEEPGVKAATPVRLNAWIALRTVCASQLRARAIAGTRSPRALARTIWQRRRTKASDERKPSSKAWRSASVSGRTKMGGLIPLSIVHSRRPCLH